MKLNHAYPILGCLVLVLGSLFLVWYGWIRPTDQSDRVDHALRSFLGVRTLRATYQLPWGEDHFDLALLNFEDGKLIGHHQLTAGNVKEWDKRAIDLQLLWGMSNGKHRLSLIVGPSLSHDEAKFWQQLDAAWSSVGTTQPQETYAKYQILGFAQSKEARFGKGRSGYPLGFAEALTRSKYVGALGIRTGKSSEDVHRTPNEE